MINVSLTGGIGSGKSLISNIFKALEIPIFNSDIEAKKILISNNLVKKQLIENFGNKTYHNNTINTKYLSQLIFNSKDNLNIINKIVHPVVFEEYSKWKLNKIEKYNIFESAIIFENNYETKFDINIAVLATRKIRIERILKRDNTSINEIKMRINSQTNDKTRFLKSDFTIKNNNNLLIPQILIINKKINTKWQNLENGSLAD